jgi:hypothetical protein
LVAASDFRNRVVDVVARDASASELICDGNIRIVRVSEGRTYYEGDTFDVANPHGIGCDCGVQP